MIMVFTSPSQKIGKWGEDRAVSYLKGHRFAIVARNVSNRFGEIDIIAEKQGTMHFFEVKTAREESGIWPAENLHRVKIRKLLKAVATYCMEHGIVHRRVQGILILQKRNGTYTAEAIDLY